VFFNTECRCSTRMGGCSFSERGERATTESPWWSGVVEALRPWAIDGKLGRPGNCGRCGVGISLRLDRHQLALRGGLLPLDTRLPIRRLATCVWASTGSPRSGDRGSRFGPACCADGMSAIIVASRPTRCGRPFWASETAVPNFSLFIPERTKSGPVKCRQPSGRTNHW